MDSLNNNEKLQDHDIGVVMVPFLAQGHLNQLMLLSYLISSRRIPIYYVGSTTHNKQAKARVNGLNAQKLATIQFHDLPIPPFASPPPDPNAPSKYPSQLQPAWDAALSQRDEMASFLRDMSHKFRRVVIVHDPMMSYVVQDVASIHNAESYAFNCVSAFSQLTLNEWVNINKGLPSQGLRQLPSLEGCFTDEVLKYAALQLEPLEYRAGDIYNTCRLIEGPYIDLLETEEIKGNRNSWAIGPILSATLDQTPTANQEQHKCLEWLNMQEPNSVLFVSFGTTTSLSDDEINELAQGLEQSKVKFIWVLRDADKGDVFDGKVRRAELPQGFEERVESVGMVVRDWAPQPQILAHKSTGGFMSHCGWNSCMESITMGVPIAAWPMHSDQPQNAVLVTEILKMGLIVRDWTERMRVVRASTIENVVKRLMASEEGVVIRKKAEELAAVVRQATTEGGVSRLELDSFIAHITR